ncbi:MAG: ribosome maturation factor RimM [Gammaproteobacteria bacterium]|nr:ribosome maturation factor RimM [Gammaproteobacteria bacterium]MDH4316435.1 ribosome maturation factor RimM [Gammaproteobacteria bacterium]MDH5214318.1 ribosome maturation factor RimM [Gammaproteobacteria bacterium]MDH5500707.1 ribosome maturation factor RimM [Gammaproteobacteria bacterium]
MPAKENTKPDREVILGRVSGLFGVKGWVKVYSFTEPRESILQFRHWLLHGSDWRRRIEVAEGRQHGKSVVVRFEGIEDRDAAAELLECEIGIRRDELPDPADGQYYWSDLEGMTVVHRDGRLLGTVAYLMATGANDVMVVQGDRETLVPFIAEKVVLDVDKAKGVISVDWEWD